MATIKRKIYKTKTVKEAGVLLISKTLHQLQQKTRDKFTGNIFIPQFAKAESQIVDAVKEIDSAQKIRIEIKKTIPAPLCPPKRRVVQASSYPSRNSFSFSGTLVSILVGLIFAGMFCTGVYVFADPPATQYNPAQTLNPSCVPGSTNCTVTPYYPLNSNPEGYWNISNAPNAAADSLTFGIASFWPDNFHVFPTNSGVIELGDLSGNITLTGTGSFGALALTSGDLNLNNNFINNGVNAAPHSVVIGKNAGLSTSTSYSVFLGENAGQAVTGSNFGSNFLGDGAGQNSYNSSQSNFLGIGAGSNTTGGTGTSNSNFLGYQAGMGAVSADNSNFSGEYAGDDATSASNSNFFGQNAGNGAINSSNSNFLGNSAGANAGSAPNSNFFGQNAGNGAGANNSNFIGTNAGQGAGGDNYSNFIGYYAGSGDGAGVSGDTDSNFIGYQAGMSAASASSSNFIGNNAGNGAVNSYYSDFIGTGAGQGATNASKSIFIGNNAGYGATGLFDTLMIDGGLGSLSPRANTAAEEANSLLFGTFADTAASQQLTVNGDVYAPVVYTRTTGSSANVYIDSTGKLWRATSSLRYKTNVQPLTDNWSAILQAQPKTFTYIDSGTTSMGYIAEDLDSLGLKDLVAYDNQGRPDSINYDRIAVYDTEILKQQQLEINALDQKLGINPSDAVINPAGTTGSGSVLGVADQSVQTSLSNLGATLSEGIMTLKNIIADNVTVKTATVDKLQMVAANGDIYCTWIDNNGNWQKAKGDCASVDTATVAEATTPTTPATESATTSTTTSSDVSTPSTSPTSSAQATSDQTQAAISIAQQAANAAQQAAQQAQQAQEAATQAQQAVVSQQAAQQQVQAQPQSLDIASVAAIPETDVAYGTGIASVNFPETASVTLSDGTSQALSVTWDNGMPSYDPETPGTYVFSGALVLSGNVTNTKNLEASVNVVVAQQPAPAGSTGTSTISMAGANLIGGLGKFIIWVSSGFKSPSLAAR